MITFQAASPKSSASLNNARSLLHARRLAIGLVAAAAFWLPIAQSACAKTVTVGASGTSGYVNLNDGQAALGLAPGDTVYIQAGTYKGIVITNITGSAAAPITVKCDPNALFTSTNVEFNDFRNLAFVTFDGFRFETYRYRCVPISGVCHDVTFKNFHMTNLGDYVFMLYDTTMIFDGTKESTYYNFTFDNVVVVNSPCAVISTAGGISNRICVLLDWEIRNCSFSGVGDTIIALYKAFNVKVHDCYFADLTSKNHVAAMYVAGYGTFYNNTFYHIWGDDVRCFALKLNALGYNGAEAKNRFYNNIGWEKRKYAMWEQNFVTQAELDAAGGIFSPASTEICFNTMYRSRKVDYVAPLVDIYAPNVIVKNNLIIEPECDAAFDAGRNYVYSLGTGPQVGLVFENNRVYSTWAAAGLSDTVSFAPSATSPVRNTATGSVSYITEDHFGNRRYVGAGDAGAVERQIAGDFSGDGMVDQADYTTWADNYGQDDRTILAPGSSNGDAIVDQADYTTWADNYGQVAPAAPMTVSQPAASAVIDAAPAQDAAATTVRKAAKPRVQMRLKRAAC